MREKIQNPTEFTEKKLHNINNYFIEKRI